MKPLRTFIILTGSLFFLLAPKKFASACGFWVQGGEYRFWLLQPDLTNEQDLTPFFFASTYLYRGDINAAVETYEDQNTDEWYHEIKQKASREDIDSLLHRTAPQYFFDHINELAKQNSFFAELNKPVNKELYRYFVMSKKVEQVTANPDPWEENHPLPIPVNALIHEADSIYHNTGSSFLKLRTAYQLMRLYIVNGQEEKLHRVYDAAIEPVKTNSWIKTTALYRKAMHTPGYESDYLLSKVFDKGGYCRSHCLFKFSQKHTDSILLFAKNRHERTVINAMALFKYPGRCLPRLKDIYNADPRYKDLPFLLLREINKIEDWLVTAKVTEFDRPAVYNTTWEWDEEDEADNYPAWNYKRDKEYSKEVYDFLLQIIGERKQDDALLKLYAAHLALLNSDIAASSELLSQIKNEKQLPPNVRSQLEINRFLLHLEKGFDPKTESEFMRIVTRSPEESGIYDAGLMKDQLVLYTARKLINFGLKSKGLMLMSRTNRALGELPIGDYKRVYQEIAEIATPKEYDEMLRIIDKKNKNTFEKFVTLGPFGSTSAYYGERYEYPDSTYWDRDKLLDCKASWYIQNHDLVSALAVLQQVPESFWSHKSVSYWTGKPYSFYIGGNPFYLNVNNAHPVTKADKRNLNKKQVLEAMIRLEKLAVTDKQKAAECYFQLANAWYNMTWYGKNWLMVKQWWSTNEPGGNAGFNQQLSFTKDYYGCYTAREYYLKALRLTTDKDLASLACLMAGICEDHFQEHIARLRGKWEDYETVPNPYKNRLKQKGMKRDVYDQLTVNECALYFDFIARYNRVL